MAAVFVNRLNTDDPETFESVYAQIAEFMLTQPGITRYMLVRSQKDRTLYYNVAEWETAEQFRAALDTDRFRELFAALRPIITGDPHVADVVHIGAPEPVAA
jgi:quinol monooxygenase YgiN